MSQEPLKHMATDKWPSLQSELLSDWPRSLPGYNILETQTRWKEAGFDYGFQVFCPFGDVRNGFVAMNEKASSYDIIVQCPKDDTKELEEALRKTNVINWESKKHLILPFAAKNVASCVEKVLAEKNLEIRLTPNDFMYTYIIEKDSPLFKDVSLPSGHSFELLTPDYAELIDSYWPHKYPTSSSYFKLLIESQSGYGLFKNGELICWILIGECGNLTHLYTMEEHRLKGYAELIVKLITNATIKDRKRDVFGFCVKHNERARKLYEKIGFKLSVDVIWPDIVTKTH